MLQRSQRMFADAPPNTSNPISNPGGPGYLAGGNPAPTPPAPTPPPATPPDDDPPEPIMPDPVQIGGPPPPVPPGGEQNTNPVMISTPGGSIPATVYYTCPVPIGDSDENIDQVTTLIVLNPPPGVILVGGPYNVTITDPGNDGSTQQQQGTLTGDGSPDDPWLYTPTTEWVYTPPPTFKPL